MQDIFMSLEGSDMMGKVWSEFHSHDMDFEKVTAVYAEERAKAQQGREDNYVESFMNLNEEIGSGVNKDDFINSWTGKLPTLEDRYAYLVDHADSE